MAVEQLTDGNPDGSVMGRSDDKLSFFGAEPSARVTVSNTTANIGTGTTFSATQKANLATILGEFNDLMDELKSKGIIG